MVKILAASDLHGDEKAAQRLADQAAQENVDLVILAGDLTLNDEWRGNLIGPFLAKNKPVLFVPGNHESFATADFLTKMYNITDLHGNAFLHKTSTDQVGFFGVGGANIGIFQVSESLIEHYLHQAHEHIKHAPKKVLVSHVHPAGTKAETMTTIFPGSTGLRNAIETLQPDLVICGHVHEAEGLEERIGNTVVHNVGEQGKIIEL